MNKKGFTIVELLAVLTILGIILLIVVPNIGGITKKTRKQLYDIQIKSLKESSNIFISDYINDLSIENGDSVTIELKLLKDMDIINQDLTNPLTDNYFSDETLITLTRNNNTFSTKIYQEDSTSYQTNIKYKKHIVLFKGSAISENTSTNLKENFIILNYDGKRYDQQEYNVVILNETPLNSKYSKIQYQINVIDDEIVTSYTLTRQENCQTGICDL